MYPGNASGAVTVVLLDASKAFDDFDRVHYARLFSLLRDRLCPLLTKFLILMYTNQSLTVSWGGATSAPFACDNGIKQGPVLSPVLFCIYMDTLLIRLRENGIGCTIGNTYAGALCYADDLTLLAPTHQTAQAMLRTCEIFAEEYCVIFNGQKSNAMVFEPTSQHNTCYPPLFLNNSAIPYCQNTLHLGVYIGLNAHQMNVKKIMNDFVSRANMITCNFSFCDFSTLCKLFNAYCTSFYGSNLWDLRPGSIADACVCWRKSVRRILSLHPMTHSAYLPFIVDRPELRVELLSRLINFIRSMHSSRNELIVECLRDLKQSLEGQRHSTSNVYLSLRSLSEFLEASPNDISSSLHDPALNSFLFEKWFDSDTITAECVLTSDAIRDMCIQKSELISFFGHENFVLFLNDLCTS